MNSSILSKSRELKKKRVKERRNKNEFEKFRDRKVFNPDEDLEIQNKKQEV